MSECGTQSCLAFEQRLRDVEMNYARITVAMEGIKSNTDELVKANLRHIVNEERQLAQGEALGRAFKSIEALQQQSNEQQKKLDEVSTKAEQGVKLMSWLERGFWVAVVAIFEGRSILSKLLGGGH